MFRPPAAANPAEPPEAIPLHGGGVHPGSAERIKLVQSKTMDLLSGSGLCLAGQVVEIHTRLRQDLNWHLRKRPDEIPTGVVVVAYLASLCLGKNDFEAVRTLEEHVLGPESLGIKAFPSPEMVR